MGVAPTLYTLKGWSPKLLEDMAVKYIMFASDWVITNLNQYAPFGFEPAKATLIDSDIKWWRVRVARPCGSSSSGSTVYLHPLHNKTD